MHPSCRRKVIALSTLLCIIFVRAGNAAATGVTTADAPTSYSSAASHIATQISWIQHMKAMRQEIKKCATLTRNTTWDCFKQSSLRIFEDIMSARVITIWDGIRLVRVEQLPEGDQVENNAAFVESKKFTDALERKDLQHLTWFDRLAMSLAKTFTTHVLQINLRDATNAYMRAMDKRENRSKSQAIDRIGTARHRRQRYNMIITMMFGVTALGAVLVPMGFQLLSVVSGKALLLAKMALLLASINGLKRVANTGLHYGLYHVPGEQFGGHGYYDRGDIPHQPRKVANLAVAPMDEFGIRK